MILKKIDDVHLLVECDRSQAAELNDYFTFEVPNARFTSSYKNGFWDGKIRLFNVHNRLLYTGLFEYVYKFAENRHYSIIPDGDWWKPKQIIPKEPL